MKNFLMALFSLLCIFITQPLASAESNGELYQSKRVIIDEKRKHEEERKCQQDKNCREEKKRQERQERYEEEMRRQEERKRHEREIKCQEDKNCREEMKRREERKRREEEEIKCHEDKDCWEKRNHQEKNGKHDNDERKNQGGYTTSIPATSQYPINNPNSEFNNERYQGHHGEITVTDGNAKIIKPDGSFFQNGQYLGRGRWYSENRYAVYVEAWGVWWVGILTPGGMNTITTNNESDILRVESHHFEKNY